MRLLFGADAYVAHWVGSRIDWVGSGDEFGPCAAIGVVDEAGQMAGGVVFHMYRPKPRSIMWSAASETPRWLTSHIVDSILAYPFEQLNCRRLEAVIPASRKSSAPARRFHIKFGFKREGTLRRAFGNEDAAYYGLLANEWRRNRFNLRKPEAHGQVVSEAAASA